MGLVLFCSEDEGQHASPQPDQDTAQAVAVLGPKPDLLEQRACCTFLVGADDLWGCNCLSGPQLRLWLCNKTVLRVTERLSLMSNVQLDHA